MAWRKKTDVRHCLAAAAAFAAIVLLSGCENDGPYADDSGLPQATYYTVVVRPGDTLSEIAHRYDASVDDVSELNRLSDESRIYSGETLRVPAGDSATRDAVLSEASNSAAHNYAPPPRPIDTTRFETRDRVTVHDLSAPSTTKSPAEMRVAARDVARSAGVDEAEHGSGRFAWPVTGPVISAFGSVGNGEKNDGINIAASTGTPIHAAAAGTVTYAGNELKGYGNLVLIQHDDGYVTAYAHAQSISVSRGDRVERGQVIGLAGATGDVDSPQLHFEIRKGVQPVNPRLLLASRD
jgi:murein DD-endopeptidase MepM/ murein hydrolase activator NlpD